MIDLDNIPVSNPDSWIEENLDGHSRGTAHMISTMEGLSKPTYVINY